MNSNHLLFMCLLYCCFGFWATVFAGKTVVFLLQNHKKPKKTAYYGTANAGFYHLKPVKNETSGVA
jgi:hypothetical protein